jgi:nucleotide-binding universal stress UspA family protein
MPRSPKAITTLACIIRVTEALRSPALDQAIELAGREGAHLIATVIAPKAAIPFSPMGSAFIAPMVEDINQQTESEASKRVTEAQEAIRRASIRGEVHLVMDHVDVVATSAVRAARASDLILVDQPVAMLDTKGLVLEEALFRSGRPVLVAAAKRVLPAILKRAMVAWDGSSHATRAVSEALALFPSLVEIEIVTVTGEKDLSKSLPGGDLAHHLARKCIEAMLTELPLGRETIGAMLNRHAEQSGADILVMGGFGHSRFREFLFGGVTVELTETASVPLLMAY